MKFKGMPIYGVTSRPYASLSDAELAAKRKAALDAGTNMPLIIAFNSETQLRQMLAGGAKMMPTPKKKR